MIKSLRKGALGDCMKRFPTIAKVVMWIFSRQIDALLVETRNHEANSRDLVQRCCLFSSLMFRYPLSRLVANHHLSIDVYPATPPERTS